MNCHDSRRELGGYVLDRISEQERADVEAHLETCAGCRAELKPLRGLPGLLELIRGEAPALPDHLRERVLAGAVRRRRLRRLAMPAAAALVVGVVIGLVAAGPLLRDDGSPRLELALEPGDGFSVTGHAVLRPTPTGLAVELHLERLPQLAEGGVYEAWLAVPGGAGPMSIGRFTADASGSAAARLSAPGTPADYRSLWVTAEPDAVDPGHDGPTVVTAPIPDAASSG